MNTKVQAEKVAEQQAPKNEIVAYDYSQEAGAGFEGASKQDFMVPMLDVIQPSSPEIAGQTIEGVKPGMLIVRALGMIWPGPEGIPFVPCGRAHIYNEWRPRESGGGLAAAHDENEQMVKDWKAKQPFGKIKLPNGNELVETFYLYGFLTPAGGDIIRTAVPYWSTKITTYRSFMTKADGITIEVPGKGRQKMPMFAHRYRIRVKPTLTEKRGFKWFDYQMIGFDAPTAQESRIDPRGALYAEARDFGIQVKEGLVKADVAGMTQNEPGADEPEENDAGAGPTGKEGKPF